jgi:hypothetical protein
MEVKASSDVFAALYPFLTIFLEILSKAQVSKQKRNCP